MRRISLAICSAIFLAIALNSCGGGDGNNETSYGQIINHKYSYLLGDGRYKAAGAVLDDSLYVAGGYLSGSSNTLSDKFCSISYKSGIKDGERTMNKARAEMSALVANAQAYFAGGMILSDGSLTETDEISMITSAKRKWLPSVLRLSTKRTNFAGVAYKNRLIYAGGEANGIYKNEVDNLDVVNAENSQVSRMKTSRSGLVAALVNDRIYFAGGRNSNGVLDEIEVYDVKENQWILIDNEEVRLSEARAELVAQTANGYVLFAGGKTNAGYSSRVDIYNMNTGKWTEAELSVPRSGIAAAASGNWIFFAGGVTGNNQYSNAVDIFDTRKGKFIQLEEKEKQLVTSRGYATAAAIKNKIYIIGGLMPNGPSQDIDIYELN
ncbi:MAG: kelch repeat-containing protein [Bacteroidales bacterium]|jgi:hypothetical protein|nr:kelch repeat-containing protein [Bacteroidales bacterium]